MTNLVQFPGLGLSFELNRVAFSIGGMNIYWYGVCIAVGLCLALVFAFRHCQEFGVDPDAMVDVILIGTVCAVIGGRAFYVATAPFEYASFAEMLDIRLGGVAIYGAVIAAFLSGYFACRWRKVPILPMFDLAGMGFLLGQGIGRWGNFVNCEAFGGYTDSLFAMRIKRSIVNESMISQELLENLITENGIEYIQVHPTFLYESMWNLGLLLFMLWYRKRKKFTGEMLLIYLTGYGIGRAWIEGLRTDQLLIPGTELAVSQVLSMVIAVISLAVLLFHRRKGPGESEETV